MTISDFVAYVKQLWKNQPDVSTPLSAERLLHMESGIKGNSDAIEKLAAAVVSQIVNDPNKIASMAALYALNQKIGDTAQLPGGAANVVAAIAKQNSDVNGWIQRDITHLKYKDAYNLESIVTLKKSYSGIYNYAVASTILSGSSGETNISYVPIDASKFYLYAYNHKGVFKTETDFVVSWIAIGN